MNNEQVGVDVDTYDRGIVPAETAARMEREGSRFKEQASEDNQSDFDTTGGATVDKEGLANNYAIEPEMYVDEPGDLRQEAENAAAERVGEIESLNQDEEGKLTNDGDKRGKGPGMI